MSGKVKKTPGRAPARASGSTSSKPGEKEKALVQKLNARKATPPVQLLGSKALAIKIRGVISTQCPALDRAIGRGGIPLSRLILLHGQEGCGKTTIALHCVAETQLRNGMAIFVDAEHKLDPDYAERIGVNLERLVISQPDYLEQMFATVEETVKLANTYRERGESFPILFVLDSINALPTKAEFEAGWEQQHIAPDASVYSSKLKKLMPIVFREDVALLFISQEREKVGVMFGSKERTGGGKAPRYYSSLILDVSRIGAVKVDEEIVGNVTQVKCVKNQIAPPFRAAEFNIIFGKGIDYEDSLFKEGLRLGVVEKSGNWYSMAGERLAQGVDNAVARLRAEQKFRQPIEAKLKEQWDGE